jgi:glutamate-1-semialdehyde 2,1-aminomutase
MEFSKSIELNRKAHRLIPGGSHTYAKADDQYPEQYPVFIERGEGCHVFDVDGNEFIEYGMGLRSVTLGYGYKRVADAAYRESLNGMNFVRPSYLEVELAETMADLIESAEMVKFGKNGSDATSAAVKLSRAFTGRDLVGIPSNQPFLSVDDWFIGSTPMAAGIPQTVRDMTVHFKYNDIASVRDLFDKYPNKIACLIMEPAKEDDPIDNFLHNVKDLCHKNGTVFILDEMITGFRWHLNGGQKYYNISPDLSTFGKAMANGFPVSALVGKKEIMNLGGMGHTKERVFLLSLTHGGETTSLAAARETIRVYRENNIIKYLWDAGCQLAKGIHKTVEELNLHEYFLIRGKPCCMVYGTRDNEGKPSQPFRTLFIQETIKRGMLMPSLIVSYAHSQKDIERTVDSVSEALLVYKKALEEGIDKYLQSRSVKPAIRKFS